MATASQLPGHLAVAFRAGDEYSTLVDFSINTTGYSWSAEVYSVVTHEVLQNPTVTVVSAANGQVNLSWTEAETADLAPGTYGCRVIWVAPGSSQRTALEGMLEVHR